MHHPIRKGTCEATGERTEGALLPQIRLDYHGGERYPQLERVSGVTDRLDEILKPQAK